MAAPATEFHLFPNLPLELRRAVWKQCLPHRRIVEIGTPHMLMAIHEISFYCPTNRNACPPIITRVCREARRVAFENGGIISELAPGKPLSPGRWLNPAADYVIHWGEPEDDDHSEDRSSQWKSLNGLGVTMYVFKRDESSWIPWPRVYIPDGVAALGFQKECIGIWAAIPIHVSVEQASSSGLFGRLVEERVKVVDMFDLETISKYRQLWDLGSCQSSAERKCIDTYSTPDCLDDNRMQDEVYALQLGWLQYRWSLDKHKATHIAENIQEEVCHTDTPILGWRDGPVECEKGHLSNTVHPWVMKQMKEMPRFSFGIMFRFCANNCGVTVRGDLPTLS